MRTHRTALIIDTSKGVDAEFRERYNRLIESLNRPPSSGPEGTIKVDIYTFDGTSIRAGAPNELDTSPSGVDFEAWAKEQGYVQLLVSANVKA